MWKNNVEEIKKYNSSKHNTNYKHIITCLRGDLKEKPGAFELLISHAQHAEQI